MTRRYTGCRVFFWAWIFLVAFQGGESWADEPETLWKNPDEVIADQRAEEEKREIAYQLGLNQVLYEVFGTELPAEADRGEWLLRINPRLGDLFDQDHIRIPFQLRYTFSRNFEGFLEGGSYIPNPFDSGKRFGFYNVRFGSKYTWHDFPSDPYALAVGVTVDAPVSNPPEWMTDGYARYEPYVVLRRLMSVHPAFLLYWNTSYQMVRKSPLRSPPDMERPNDRLILRPGMIYYPGGRYRYSMELEGRSDRLTGGNTDEVVFYPMVTWFPTREVREGLFLPGNWDLSVRLRVPLIEETGESFGVSIRFRWYYDYGHRLMRGLSALNFRQDSGP